MSTIVTVKLDGAEHTIDLDRLTFAEGRAVESVTGQSFGDAMKSQSLTSIQALVWVTVKRGAPGTKFSDLDDRAISDVDFNIQSDDPVDPTVPAGD